MDIRRPTLKTVAQAAGVSLPTVSQVLRGVGRISEETRERVIHAANAVGYVPDDRAVSVRTGRSKEVSIIVHDLANSFNAELIHGAYQRLEKNGFFLSVMDALGDAARLEKLVRFALSKNCAGLLWVPSEKVDPALVKLIKKQQIPNVTFLRGLVNSDFPSLRIANAHATQKATQYLLSLGHEHIAYAGGIGDNQTRRQRITGYEMAMGMRANRVFDAVDTKHGGFDFADFILKTHPDVTAVICNGDEFAIGLCLGLQRLGKTPGQDISVIGFDDIDEAELITPSLTTLSISPTIFGDKIAQLLMQRLESNSGIISQEWLEAELIIRESTAAPPSNG